MLRYVNQCRAHQRCTSRSLSLVCLWKFCLPNRTLSHAATYSIGELSTEFDLTTRAIRFYEDMGLLAPTRSGAAQRLRVYSARDRTRLKLTLRAKRLGLSLSEAKDLIDMYESPKDTGPQLRKYQSVLASHRVGLEQQIAELHAQLDEIKAHEKEARNLLAKAASKPAENP